MIAQLLASFLPRRRVCAAFCLSSSCFLFRGSSVFFSRGSEQPRLVLRFVCCSVVVYRAAPYNSLPRCLLSIYRRPTSAVQCRPVVPCISCEADASGCSLGTPQSDVLEPVHVFPPHCCSDVSAGHSNTRDCDLNHRLSFKCCYSVDS